MARDNCPVVAAVVDRYDSTGHPVSPAAIARDLGRDEAAVAGRLEELAACELVASADEGYRPTVTGREFLALDIECGPIIVDPDDSP